MLTPVIVPAPPFLDVSLTSTTCAGWARLSTAIPRPAIRTPTRSRRGESDSVTTQAHAQTFFLLWLVTAGRGFDGCIADASSYLLDEPLQVGRQGHTVDVGDVGGAQLDLGVAK